MSWGGSIPLRTRSCRRYTGCGCRRRVRGAGRRADGRSGNPDRPSSTRLRQGDELLEEVPGAVGVGPVRHVGGVAGHVAGNRRAGEHELAAQGDEVRAAGVAVAGAAEVAALVHRKADPGWVEGVEVERSLHPVSGTVTGRPVAASEPRSNATRLRPALSRNQKAVNRFYAPHPRHRRTRRGHPQGPGRYSPNCAAAPTAPPPSCRLTWHPTEDRNRSRMALTPRRWPQPRRSAAVPR